LSIGTRAFLKQAWQWRNVERLFLGADAPPGSVCTPGAAT
jgi:hypothetical protein